MKPLIYLDYAATTPVDTSVAQVMMRYLTCAGEYGNPASQTHGFGQNAKVAVEQARQQVAAMLNAQANEIIWTSGATEADNLALKGAAQLYQRQGKHIITVKTEHKAILDTCQELEKSGFTITYLTPHANGIITPEKFLQAIQPDTIIASIMHLHNETGVIQDIAKLAHIAKQQHIIFHVDAAQSGGKLPLDVQQIPVDLVSLSAHKMYGPKGMGALYVRRKPRVRVAPQIHGGGHEQGMRSGTLATHQIVGMGCAAELALKRQAEDLIHLTELKKTFLQVLSNAGVRLNTTDALTYPGIVSICCPGVLASKLITACPELAISTGSACESNGLEPSYVLRAMGLSREEAACSVRISFGRQTTLDDVIYAAEKIKAQLKTN